MLGRKREMAAVANRRNGAARWPLPVLPGAEERPSRQIVGIQVEAPTSPMIAKKSMVPAIPSGLPALILTNPAKGAIPLALVSESLSHAAMHLGGREEPHGGQAFQPDSKAESGWNA